MKAARFLVPLFTFLLVGSLGMAVHAQEITNQTISLAPGWNIVSTPKVLVSHDFSAEETSENFDIYLLDASAPTGWATMADLGQTEFTPLYGYFVNNKTGVPQTLTFNYDTGASPHERLFEREFEAEGWYSIGVANGEYAKAQNANTTDTNNPSKILSLPEGKYDLVIDFTHAVYNTAKASVALSDPWKAVVPADINALNDLRETKGYVIYIKTSDAKYSGFQNGATTTLDKLVVDSSSEDPDASTLRVETDSVSDWTTVFAFDLDTQDAANEILLKTLVVGLQTGVAPVEDVVHDAKLVIGGEEYDDYQWLDASSSNARLVFNSDSLVIDSDSRVTAEVQVEFKPLDGSTYGEGETIVGYATSSGWVAESINGVTFSGFAEGDTHTLRTSDVVVDNVITSANVTTIDGPTNDYVIFEIEFDVTPLEQDAYIAVNPGVSMNFEIHDASGTDVSDIGMSTAALDATADDDGSFFIVNEGETETFTLTVTYRPEVTNQTARLQLVSIEYSETASAPDTVWMAEPLSDYRTSSKVIVN